MGSRVYNPARAVLAALCFAMICFALVDTLPLIRGGTATASVERTIIASILILSCIFSFLGGVLYFEYRKTSHLAFPIAMVGGAFLLTFLLSGPVAVMLMIAAQGPFEYCVPVCLFAAF